MYYKNLSLFLDDNHNVEGLEYPIATIQEGFITSTTIELQDLSNPNNLNNNTFKTFNNPMYIKNKNIKVLDVLPIVPNKLLYLLLKIDELDQPIAFHVTLDYLNFIFESYADMTEIQKDKFILYSDTKDSVQLIPDDLKNPIRLAICTENYEDREYLGDKYNVGSIYLNSSGEKALYLGEVYRPLEFSYVIDIEQYSKANYIAQHIWLPITNIETRLKVNKIEYIEFNTLQEFLQYYAIHLEEFLPITTPKYLNMTRKDYVNNNQYKLLNNLFVNSSFEGVVEYKKVVQKDVSFSLDKYFLHSATYNIISKLDKDFKKVGVNYFEYMNNSIKKSDMITLYELMLNSEYRIIFNDYFKSKYYLNNEKNIMENQKISLSLAYDYLFEIVSNFTREDYNNYLN